VAITVVLFIVAMVICNCENKDVDCSINMQFWIRNLVYEYACYRRRLSGIAGAGLSLYARLISHCNVDVDVDVVDLRAQADASMPASNNNVKLYNISNF